MKNKITSKQQIITWWSASGGVGRTTLSLMQAFMFARKFEEKIAFLDFNEVTPCSSWYLNMQQCDSDSILDALEKNSMSASFLESVMFEHQIYSNLKVFTGVPLDRFEQFKVKHYLAIIEALSSFSYIIIDTNPGIFFSSTYAALKKSSTVNVITLPVYSSIYYTKTMIDFAVSRWEIPRDRFKIYINKICPEGVEPGKVKKVLEDYEIKDMFLYNPKVVKASYSGDLFLKGFEELFEKNGKLSLKKRGIFSFLKRKRW